MTTDNTPTVNVDEEIERIQAQRRKMRAALEAECKRQLLVDLEAVSNLEVEHGAANVATLRTNFAPGLPAMFAVRVPDRAEMKRYQDTIKPSDKGKIGDFQKAYEQLGAVCLAYPMRGSDLFEELLKQRPAVKIEAGHAALKLGESREEEEGKG